MIKPKYYYFGYLQELISNLLQTFSIQNLSKPFPLLSLFYSKIQQEGKWGKYYSMKKQVKGERKKH
jgi:hypothetical protein